MSQVLPESFFTFQVLFTNAEGNPADVSSPLVTIFYFNDSGLKVPIVTAAVLLPVNPPETGRYVYTVQVPLNTEGKTLYGTMWGTDISTGLTLIVEQEVAVVGYMMVFPGLIAQFVKGG
jgi:hypothetical protein